MSGEIPELGLTQQDLADGFFDAIAMVEAYKAGDWEGMGVLVSAQGGRNALGLVIGLLQLLTRELSGEDVAEWAAARRAEPPHSG